MKTALLLVLVSLLMPAAADMTPGERGILEAVADLSHVRPRPDRLLRLHVDVDGAIETIRSVPPTHRLGKRELVAVSNELLESLHANNQGKERLGRATKAAYYRVSRPGISADGLTAIVLEEKFAGGYAESADFLYLEKKAGVWAVTASGPGWEY
jgi:hypothetical protein